MKNTPVALQLYSVRDDCAKDFEKTLAAVAEMGYEGVEFAGYYQRSAKDIAELLSKNGLQCAGTHTQLTALLGDELEKTVEFNKAIGSSFIVVPGLPKEYKETLDGWKKAAVVFNGLAEKTKKFGVKVGYHNHAVEFQKIEGQYPWDVLFSNCSKDVIMQIDTGNAMIAGVDASPFFEKYPGRSTTVHLKEWSDKPEGAVIGEGVTDWKKVMTLAETAGGAKWFIVEQETYQFEPLECVRKCLENIKKMR